VWDYFVDVLMLDVLMLDVLILHQIEGHLAVRAQPS
jgi:hypothetical protein